MKKPFLLARLIYAWLVLGLVLPALPARPAAAIELPAWAYPVNPPDFKPTPDDGSLRRVADSAAGHTLTQLRNLYAAPDWHPEDHPPMPEIVARGRAPEVQACGFCHRADGPGGPENASLAGLSYAYIIQQFADYRNGLRASALPKRVPQALMIGLSKRISDDEIKAAATYFSALPPRRNLRVIETDWVPQTYVAGWFLAARTDGSKELLGQRIIEVPENLEHFESRDARATFIAYVPPGSLARGEALVSGKIVDKVVACGSCHGPELRGIEAVPALSGRSPSYLIRQLYELQAGLRAGANAAPMKDAIAKLDLDDMIAIAAWLASRNR
jgi:cytochrome c553